MAQSLPPPSSPEPLKLTQYQVLQQKLQEQREKSRVRMARYRQNLKTAPPDKQEASKQRAREARARYREKNRSDLAAALRCKRLVEFSNKFGFEAYEAKVQRRAERARIRSERMRRKARPRVRGKPRKRAPSSEPDADESGSESDDSSDTDADMQAPLRRCFK
ncbi:hypothetical protein DFH06DRAFT_1143104 [Mycena polygramma]|nr:hypothetical protein DFH06DRAFT_1143104 [Mycena polygramma]